MKIMHYANPQFTKFRDLMWHVHELINHHRALREAIPSLDPLEIKLMYCELAKLDLTDSILNNTKMGRTLIAEEINSTNIGPDYMYGNLITYGVIDAIIRAFNVNERMYLTIMRSSLTSEKDTYCAKKAVKSYTTKVVEKHTDIPTNILWGFGSYLNRDKLHELIIQSVTPYI